MNKVTRLYADLIDEINRNGYRVVHRRLKNFGGFARHFPYNLIAISSEYKNTLYGCYMLGHEFGHALDYINYKFPKYHHSGDFFAKKMPISYIRRLEWSATELGKKILKDRGFKIKRLNLTKRDFEKSMKEHWIPYYNGTRIKRHLKLLKAKLV